MNKLILIAIAIFTAFAVARIGSYLAGYTAAITMPRSFAHPLIMFGWDILVVQCMSFGAAAILFSFVFSLFFTAVFWISVGLTFVAYLLILYYPFEYSLYWSNAGVVFVAVLTGHLAAKKTKHIIS